MREMLLYILKEKPIVIDAIGVVSIFFPAILAMYFIVQLPKNKILNKIFKLPKDIRECREIKKALIVLGYIGTLLLILIVIMGIMVFYYLIYYGLFLPKLYDIKVLV